MSLNFKTKAGNYGVLNQVFVHQYANEKLSPTQSHMLGFLAYHIAKHGKSTHSKRTIAARLFCSRSTVKVGIKALIDKGWIKTINSTSNKSGTAFVFGSKLPFEIKEAYECLTSKKKRTPNTGALLGINLKELENLNQEDRSTKKAASWRSEAFLKALVIYQSASSALNKPGNPSCEYRNRTALGRMLGKTVETVNRYIMNLKNAGLIKVSTKGLLRIVTEKSLQAEVRKYMDKIKTKPKPKPVKDHISFLKRCAQAEDPY